MTACNLIVRPEAAYLIADTAVMDDGHALTGLQSKVAASDRLRLAIAITGRASSTFSDTLASWLEVQPGQGAALEALPLLLADLSASRDAVDAALLIEPGSRRQTIGLAVALHSKATGKPEGYVIASDSTLHRGLRAMTARRTGQFINPQVPGVFLGGWPFAPRADGRDLLFRQRGTEHHASRDCIVGGSGELATVTAAGVKVETICRWPDRIGERIDAARPAKEAGRLRAAFGLA
jgi:hypothetical protein